MSDLLNAVLRAQVYRFIGRLGRDPELRTLQSGKCVANVRMAVSRPGARRDDGQESDWFKLELWNELATEFVDHCAKGCLVDVTGRVKSESWTDRSTGEARSGLVVEVREWSLVPTPGQPGHTPAAAPARPAAPAAAPAVWESSGGATDPNWEPPF
jgi:single-strand DNA-binding protein